MDIGETERVETVEPQRIPAEEPTREVEVEREVPEREKVPA